MTHFVGLVFGSDIEGQLDRYDENRKVEPYKMRSDPESLKYLYDDEDDIDPSNPHELAAFLNDKWPDEPHPYLVDDEGIYTMSTYNEDAKWDWYAIGGRWPNWLIKLDGGRADAALADEVDWDATILDWGYVPSVVVAEGVWRASKDWGWWGVSDPTPQAEDWDEWFITFVSRAGGMPVTVLDFHI